MRPRRTHHIHRRETDRRRGFSLVELLVVIAIFNVVLAVALANFLSTQKAANESSAIAGLRAIQAANVLYDDRYGFYAPSLGELRNVGFLDPVLAGAGSGEGKAGYLFTYASDGTSWQTNADPTVPGQTGDRHFFIAVPGVIRAREGGPATSADPPIGNFKRGVGNGKGQGLENGDGVGLQE